MPHIDSKRETGTSRRPVHEARAMSSTSTSSTTTTPVRAWPGRVEGVIRQDEDGLILECRVPPSVSAFTSRRGLRTRNASSSSALAFSSSDTAVTDSELTDDEDNEDDDDLDRDSLSTSSSTDSFVSSNGDEDAADAADASDGVRGDRLVKIDGVLWQREGDNRYIDQDGQLAFRYQVVNKKKRRSQLSDMIYEATVIARAKAIQARSSGSPHKERCNDTTTIAAALTDMWNVPSTMDDHRPNHSTTSRLNPLRCHPVASTPVSSTDTSAATPGPDISLEASPRAPSQPTPPPVVLREQIGGRIVYKTRAVHNCSYTSQVLFHMPSPQPNLGHDHLDHRLTNTASAVRGEISQSLVEIVAHENQCRIVYERRKNTDAAEERENNPEDKDDRSPPPPPPSPSLPTHAPESTTAAMDIPCCPLGPRDSQCLPESLKELFPHQQQERPAGQYGYHTNGW